MAQETEVSAPDLIERLVEREEQERLLKAMNDDFERLRSDDAAWTAFKADTAMWYTTSGDG